MGETGQAAVHPASRDNRKPERQDLCHRRARYRWGHEHRIDTKTGAWSQAADLPGDEMNGFNPASVVVGGQLYLSPADGKVYQFVANTWTEVSTISKGRWVHRAVPIGDDRALVLGGASKDGNVAACKSFPRK